MTAGENLAPDPSAPTERAVFLPRCAALLLGEQGRGEGERATLFPAVSQKPPAGARW